MEDDRQPAALLPLDEGAELGADEPYPRHASGTASAAPQALSPDRREGPDKPGHAAEGPRAKRSGDEGRGSGRRRRHPLIMPIAAVLALVAAAGGYLYWDDAQHFESTDDAFIAARQFPIAPKIAGYITAVPVTDNEQVADGAVIARIDDRDYRIALTQAEAEVQAAQANIEDIDAQQDVQQAQIRADKAQVDSAEAALGFAQDQATRYRQLASKGFGPIQSAQQYSSQLRQQEAAVETAQANLQLAQRQVEALKAQRDSAVAKLAEAAAQRDQARLNLSYTTVRAAQAGRVVELSAAVGELAQTGTNLAMLVPDRVWVTANFKETQLDAMRPDQPVTLHIDAYPDRDFHGHVASIQPGSGTAFSLLPAENATGNYVKIVQRVPVKIIIDNPPSDVALGPGMSVEPTVRVNPAPSLYERLRGWL